MSKLRKILLCLFLGMASLQGAPMRAEEIEELMHSMNQPRVELAIPDETEKGDDPIEELPGGKPPSD